MAYKRKRTASRNYSRKRRRIFRRPLRVPRGVRAGKSHLFKRVTEAPSITLNMNAPTTWAYAFQLADLPNVSEFVNLFDQYRVNKLKVMIVPNFTGLDGGFVPFGNKGIQLDNMYDSGAVIGSSIVPLGKNVIWPQGLPNIHSVIDYDSAIVNDLSQLMQHRTYRMTRGNRIHSRYWTPAISLGTNCSTSQNSVTEPTAQKFKQWLGTDATCVPHYGIKLLVDGGPIINWYGVNPAETPMELGAHNTPVQEIKLRVYVTAYIECKGVR